MTLDPISREIRSRVILRIRSAHRAWLTTTLGTEGGAQTCGSTSVFVTGSVDLPRACGKSGALAEGKPMPRKPSLASRLQQLQELRPKKSQLQIPVGWWQDAKHRNQPPGSYLDPSLRIDSDGAPLDDPESERAR